MKERSKTADLENTDEWSFDQDEVAVTSEEARAERSCLVDKGKGEEEEVLYVCVKGEKNVPNRKEGFIFRGQFIRNTLRIL